MRQGICYNQTYASVASWESIRILLYTVLRNNLKTIYIDYLLSFPQSSVERECYIDIPKVIEVHSETKWVINLKKNIYGQNKAGKVLHKFLVEKSTSSAVGFRQRNIDECLFYQVVSMYILYTDNYILEVPDEE